MGFKSKYIEYCNRFRQCNSGRTRNYLRCKKCRFCSLLNGQVVSLVGSSGDRGQVVRADASNMSLASRLAVVTIDSCNVNADCPVTTFGRVNELDTSAWSSGTLLYLSADGSGNLTSTSPSEPNFRVLIAAVIRSHATEGIILVSPQ
ncbi:MAG: hypothetical protein OQK82_07285, partial [Candidatus Pacearchaeota archaeon]|nr:hypothetical protein [Candidatus Pacearchaeota archaeon]